MAATYVVQPGDSLWSIAEKFYGDGTKWNVIYEANRSTIGDNPNYLQAGTTLTIPDLAVPPPPSGSQTYVTTDTDTLWSIAEQFYGDGSQWPKIYQANVAVIGPDPNVIHGGMTLTIPA